MTKKEFKQLQKSILEACKPMMEDMIQELKSTTFYDAAVKADRYNNTSLAQRFREAGDAALDAEKRTEFEESLNVYREFTVNGYDFILAEYIPTAVDVLICLKDKAQALAVRISGNDLEEIENIETRQDIASLFKRKPVIKPNVPTLGAIMNKSREFAKELAGIINDELGTEISWRWFFADRKVKSGIGTSDGKYAAQAGATAEGYHIGIAKRATDQAMYSIFYLLVGNKEKSFVLTIYKTLKGVFVYGNQQPAPIYRTIMKSQPTWEGDLAVPTPKSSDIQNIYEFFSGNRRIGRMTFDFVARNIDIRLSTDDIADAAERDADKKQGAKWNSFNNSYKYNDADEEIKKNEPQQTDDDMGDFADL